MIPRYTDQSLANIQGFLNEYLTLHNRGNLSCCWPACFNVAIPSLDCTQRSSEI